ncbi:MAG TPA: MoxR family ATPase, partial [Acidimicrobiales bacterium]|nr:MoxR family ATPase [Acidimicrobiales bacterium]
MSRQQPADPSAAFAATFTTIVENVERVIQGKVDVIQLALLCMLSEGHLLIEDVPGVGKTSLAKSIATSIKCTFGRVQFTPDLLPSDVVGVSVYNRASGDFEFRAGPIFANVVLGDEINRASPKTQSALLEAMAEQQVTVDGTTYPLDGPFMVIATQNPIEHEGTYPLPESQLDRFFMRVSVGYPARDAELEMLEAHGDHDAYDDITAVVRATEIQSMIETARNVHLAPSLKGYLIELAEATRRHPRLALGMSPRATLNLQRAARSRAVAAGRSYVVPDDIKALAEPVLAHRLIVTPEAQLAGMRSADVLDEVLRSVPVP